MNIGKISETVLKRSVFKQIRHRRLEVIERPGVGKDCALIEIGQDEVFSISSDPITGTVDDIGRYAVYASSNDIAASGAELIGLMLTILLPAKTEEPELRKMMQEIEAVCKELNCEVIGGHTEVTEAVNQPIITMTGIGKLKKKDIMKSSFVKPGQEIILTKWVGLEGASIIAAQKENELRTRYTSDFIKNAKDFILDISIVKEALIGKRMGVTSMHDVTEGGIFGALWELGEASRCGIEADLKKIPLRQETVEICEFFDLNPYMLISGGALLMTAENGNELVRALESEGIHAVIIGKVTAGHDKVILNEDEKRYLEPPKSDELYKVV